MFIPPHQSLLTGFPWGKVRQKPTTTTTVHILTTTSNFYSSTQINQTTQNLTTFILTTYSSMINTTQKNYVYIRNKIFFSLILSLIFISLCIGLSYCIFIYFNHYINTKSMIKHDHRVSVTHSIESNSEPQSLLCNINKRRSSCESINLFRY